MIKLILIIYFCLEVAFLTSIYHLYFYPKKKVWLRRILCFFYGIRNYGVHGIEFQSSAFGCGYASLKMLLRRLNAEKTIECLDNHDPLIRYNMMNMYFIWQFLEGNGFKSKGYEFTNSEQLKKMINKNEKKHSLLLMKSYDEFNGFTISFILLFPLSIIKKIFSPFKHLSSPVYHWVFLDELKEKKVYISDPFFGKISMKKKQFNRLWTKYGLVISKKLKY